MGKLCLEAVRKIGSTIMFVPEEHKTEELCLEALKNDILNKAHKYVPEKYLPRTAASLQTPANTCSSSYVSSGGG